MVCLLIYVIPARNLWFATDSNNIQVAYTSIIKSNINATIY